MRKLSDIYNELEISVKLTANELEISVKLIANELEISVKLNERAIISNKLEKCYYV